MNVIRFPTPLRMSLVRHFHVETGPGALAAVVFWPAAAVTGAGHGSGGLHRRADAAGVRVVGSGSIFGTVPEDVGA